MTSLANTTHMPRRPQTVQTEMKLLAYEKYGIIQLTEEGRKIENFF